MRGAQPRKDTVRPHMDRVRRELEAFGRMTIRIGVQGDEDGDILMIAGVHEYGCTIQVTPKMRAFLHRIGLHLRQDTGTITIPERSFIRASYDTGKETIATAVRDAVQKINSGEMTAREAAEQIGAKALNMTLEYFNTRVSPAKGTFTQSRSTQFQPLVDTGRLASSITCAVVEEG